LGKNVWRFDLTVIQTLWIVLLLYKRVQIHNWAPSFFYLFFCYLCHCLFCCCVFGVFFLCAASYFHTITFCFSAIVSCLCVIVCCPWLLFFAFDYYFLFSCCNCFLPSSYYYLPSCHYFLISINVVCFCVVTSFPIATSCLHTLVMQYCLNICSFLLLLCFSLCYYYYTFPSCYSSLYFYFFLHFLNLKLFLVTINNNVIFIVLCFFYQVWFSLFLYFQFLFCCYLILFYFIFEFFYVGLCRVFYKTFITLE
jgi:hypothetical protein